MYINTINERLVFKIKDWYKLELKSSEPMNSFGSAHKLIDKAKNGENVPSLEVVEVVFVWLNYIILRLINLMVTC